MVRSLDHLVLTVRDLEESVWFYTEVLGMQHVVFGEGRQALGFGNQKINLHQAGKEFEPKAASPTPGSADLCFLLDGSLEEARARFETHQISIVEGPVQRTGAAGKIESLYVRDPDGNLIEVSVLKEDAR